MTERRKESVISLGQKATTLGEPKYDRDRKRFCQQVTPIEQW